jgi:hypothetical protein
MDIVLCFHPAFTRENTFPYVETDLDIAVPTELLVRTGEGFGSLCGIIYSGGV